MKEMTLSYYVNRITNIQKNSELIFRDKISQKFREIFVKKKKVGAWTGLSDALAIIGKIPSANQDRRDSNQN